MIGYANTLYDYFKGTKPKKAQSIPASLFFRKDDNMGIEGAPFDLFISEKHKLTFKVGDHPLQNGCTVSDHVRRELREVTIEGMFTNHPMSGLEQANEITFKDDYATSEVKPTLQNRALIMFEKVKRLANFKEPVRLVCSLETYPKMIITEIDYDRDSKSGSSIRFTMTLREIETVDISVSTQDIAFNPKDMGDENSRMLAAMCTSGKTNSESISAAGLAKLEGVSVFSP